MEQFTKEELKTLSILIQKSQITGADSIPVALLLQKISKLLEVREEKKEDKK